MGVSLVRREDDWPILERAIPRASIEDLDRAGGSLVICMNRSHLLNDHMLGFVNVVDDEDEQ